jgi:hypothetical protein
MPNAIEYTNLVPTDSFVTPLSRYRDSSVIQYEWRGIKRLAFTTYKRKPIPERKDDRYTVITAGTEYRPDKVSVDAYGIPDLWWRILEANNIKDIFDFKAGKTIRIPGGVW